MGGALEAGGRLSMAAEPAIALLEVSGGAQRTPAMDLSAKISDYWALTKPEVNFLILLTTLAGFYLAPATESLGFRTPLVIHTLLGTLLVASGTGTLNQFLERSFDAQMRRTARRPLASGRLKPSHVLWFGISLAAAGIAYLAVAVNMLASMLAAVTLVSYLFLYTPLKRKTPLCTFVGAFPGAVPPLIGWAAARGRLDPAAWVLYAIVFLWQFPHFMSIAWMYREDYRRAGYLVLPASKLNNFVAWQCLLPALGLFAVAIVPALRGQSGIVYFAGALVLGGVFLYYSARFALERSTASARQLLFASILYLPMLFALLALDKK
jgi:protoheme IX farnesyltransferase